MASFFLASLFDVSFNRSFLSRFYIRASMVGAYLSANAIPFDSIDQIGLMTDSYTKFHEESEN